MQIQEISDQKMLFFLSEIPGFGAASIQRLYEKIKPLSRLLHIEEKELLEFEVLRRDQIHALLLEQKNWLEIEECYQELTERKITFVTPLEPSYPDKLRQIHHPPMGLYVRGQLPKEEKKSVAIVGSRYAKVLAENGVQIISGLAHGVDAAAHAGAIRFGLSFGVLGCGINIAYPKENYTLYEKMANDGGGIISEYPLGTSPLGKNFPIRNRIISGLSDIVLVIEARERSGSLITVEHALEQGKEVFALPGRVSDPMSKGCNALIFQGASIATSPEVIMESLGILRDKKLQVQGNLRDLLATNEKRVYSCLDLQSKFLEDIATEVNMDFGELTAILLELELKGLVRQVSSHYYAKNN